MAAFDWLLMCTAVVFWGSSVLFMEVALEVEHPGLVAWLRPVLGVCFVALVPSARRPVDAAARRGGDPAAPRLRAARAARHVPRTPVDADDRRKLPLRGQ